MNDVVKVIGKGLLATVLTVGPVVIGHYCQNKTSGILDGMVVDIKAIQANKTTKNEQ